MHTQSEPDAHAERRWDRGSWAALAFALFCLLLVFLPSALTWPVPGDGWLVNGDRQADPPRAYFESNLNEGPTPIQQGDELLTVEGLPLKEIIARQFKFFRVSAPDWGDGTILHYTVRRHGRVVALDVPQHVFSPWQMLVAQWRISPGTTLVTFLASPFFLIVGLMVFFLRPRNRAAHALLILGVAFLFQIVPSFYWVSTMFYSFAPPSIPVEGWTLAINPSIMYMALAFPAPKLPIRRFPRLTIAFLYLSAPLALNTAYLLNLDHPVGYFNAATVVYVSQILLVFVITFGSLIHSALTVREPVARAQLKWVALGLMSFIIPGLGGWLMGYLLGPFSEWLSLLSVTGWFVFPVSLAIAITRYRLFDIDLIIRRTLQYTVLSGLLALTYFGLVIVLQSAFTAITGQRRNEFVTVLSTLAIAVLFNSIRRRVQDVIDRRFYRKKYDAAKTLAAFAATCRDETDLDKLTARLVEVVQETMQPESVSLWLKPTAGGRRLTTDSRPSQSVVSDHYSPRSEAERGPSATQKSSEA